MDDGFHRSPLVPGCLKVLKYLFPRAVRAAQCHPSNELNRFGSAAQDNRRAGADTQLWIDWKVRHDALMLSRGRSSRWDRKPALSISSAYARKQSRHAVLIREVPNRVRNSEVDHFSICYSGVLKLGGVPFGKLPAPWRGRPRSHTSPKIDNANLWNMRRPSSAMRCSNRQARSSGRSLGADPFIPQ